MVTSLPLTRQARRSNFQKIRNCRTKTSKQARAPCGQPRLLKCFQRSRPPALASRARRSLPRRPAAAAIWPPMSNNAFLCCAAARRACGTARYLARPCHRRATRAAQHKRPLFNMVCVRRRGGACGVLCCCAPSCCGALPAVSISPAWPLCALCFVRRRQDGPAKGVAVAARWRPKTARRVLAHRSSFNDRVSAAEIKTSRTSLLN